MASFDISKIGFSTGALAKGDLARGVEISRQLELSTIELSALRLNELGTLIEFSRTQDLSGFGYVSVHAPGNFGADEEEGIAHALERIAHERNWPIVLHPDAVHDFNHWRSLGSSLCIENMDKRKSRGRTVEELVEILAFLPDALICFDIAHARQVDSSMTEAYRILRHFCGRIRQMHFSEVSSDSGHRQVSDSAFRAYGEVAHSIPLDVPVILESVLTDAPDVSTEARQEIGRVSQFLARSAEQTTELLTRV